MGAKKDDQPVPEAPETIDFEKAYARLETIVETLDEGQLPLDQLLKTFEEGIELARACGKRLDDVERRVQILIADSEGEEHLEDFDPDA